MSGIDEQGTNLIPIPEGPSGIVPDYWCLTSDSGKIFGWLQQLSENYKKDFILDFTFMENYRIRKNGDIPSIHFDSVKSVESIKPYTFKTTDKRFVREIANEAYNVCMRMGWVTNE